MYDKDGGHAVDVPEMSTSPPLAVLAVQWWANFACRGK